MRVVLFSTNGHIRTFVNKTINDKCKMYSTFTAFKEIKEKVDLFIVDTSLKQDQFELVQNILIKFPLSNILCLINYSKEGIYKVSNTFFFLSKPIDLLQLNKAINSFKYSIKINPTVNESDCFYDCPLIGESTVMRKVKASLRKLSLNNSPVYIFGETGTGKELAARVLHENSQFRNNEMVCINSSLLNSSLCEAQLFGYRKGAYTGAFENRSGLIEKANNSTLFLDEVENMSMEVQSSFLRLMENGEYRKLGDTMIQQSKFRLISASNIRLENLIKSKKLRKDFYYRIALFSIEMPPLRTHLEDLPLLINHYFKKVGEKRPLENSFINKLEKLSFEGNVRELNGILERCRVYSDNDRIVYSN